MLIPLLFVFGLALVGLKLGQKLQPADFRVGATLPMLPPAPMLPPGPKPKPVSYVAVVNRKLSLNQPISDWLLCEATREAFDRQDWDTVRQLSDAFDDVDSDQSPEQPEENTDAPEEQPQKPEAPDTSPLDGVALDDWQAFCTALATRLPGHRSERHAGKYEQNLSRLRQLGIEIPATEEEEYKALVVDMADYWEGEGKLLQESSGEVLSLSGQEHPVTPSGILGLLKAAGPQGARSWLANEQDRARFPKTTETFLRCNGCF